MILPNFVKNCMKVRKFWAMGGKWQACPPKSATVNYNYLSHHIEMSKNTLIKWVREICSLSDLTVIKGNILSR